MGKRKRTDAESLLEASAARESNAEDEVRFCYTHIGAQNLILHQWTPRENYELMVLYRDQPQATTKRKSEQLHRKMSGLRETNLSLPKLQRSELEIRTQRRDLMNSGVTIEGLEDEIWPDEKKGKKQKKGKKKSDN